METDQVLAHLGLGADVEDPFQAMAILEVHRPLGDVEGVSAEEGLTPLPGFQPADEPRVEVGPGEAHVPDDPRPGQVVFHRGVLEMQRDVEGQPFPWRFGGAGGFGLLLHQAVESE